MKATIIIILLFASTLLAQTPTTDSRRVIEVTGSAETLITPNEFTFRIRLAERVDGKKKITIEEQEAALRRELAAIGVDVTKSLSVFDITSIYVRQRRMRDTLAIKDYRLKLNDPAKIAELQEVADRVNVNQLDLVDSTHTDLVKFREETKKDALRAARAKAEYLLSAIGEKVGRPVHIKEIEDPRLSSSSNFMTNSISVNSQRVASDSSDSGALSFTQIRLRFEIFAVFEIQ
jgi:hypothetical protein